MLMRGILVFWHELDAGYNCAKKLGILLEDLSGRHAYNVDVLDCSSGRIKKLWNVTLTVCDEIFA